MSINAKSGMQHETIVISVGGSLIVPGDIDTVFLSDFRDEIVRQTRKGKKFAIICGGGKTARKYQNAAKSLSQISNEDLDWIGIHATRINAHLMLSVLRKYANKKIVKNPASGFNFEKNVIIAAGWKPGFSTDYDAVLIAKKLKARRVVNLSNIKCVYDKDPNKFKSAKPIRHISWADFRKLLPAKWDPGLNAPFDPIASREAQRTCLEVAILDGKNIKNFRNYIEGKAFEGTIIR